MASGLQSFIDEIKTDIRDRAQLAMMDSKSQSAAEGHKEFLHYYDGEQPTLYKRTGQLGESLRMTPEVSYRVNVDGDTISYSFYIKEPFYGPAPNGNREEFIKRGYPSTLEGYRVINATNEGYKRTYGLKGNPHYWDKTLKHIEENLNSSMRQMFN